MAINSLPRRSNKRSAASTLAVAVVCLGAVAACGSSGSKPAASSSAGGGGTTSTSGSTATTGGTSTAAATGSPYVVGATEDLSGPLASYGTNVQKAFQAAFTAANSSGGVNGHQVQLQIKDDKSVLTTALSNIRALLSSKAVVTTGSTLSDFCTAIGAIDAKSNTPEICTNTDPKDLKPVQPYLFNMNPPEALTVPPIMEFGQQQSGVAKPKVGMMVAGAGGAIAFGDAASAYATSHGWSVSDYEKTSATTVTLPTGQVSKLAASKPDMVLVEEIPSNTTSLVQDLRQDGYTGPIIAQNPDFPGLAQTKDTKFFMATATEYVPLSSTDTGAKQFISEMAGAGVTTETALNDGQLSLDWVRAQDILAALKNCSGTCDGAALQKSLENTSISFPGVVDKYGYTSTDHVPVTTQYIYGWDSTAGAPKLEEPAAAMGTL